MNKKRLLKLAALLEKDASNPEGVKFDMSTWGEVKGKKATMSCGTKVCAMGLAAISGVFKKQGLRYHVEENLDRSELWIDIGFKGDVGLFTDGFTAAQRLFDITSQESSFLFSDHSYPRRMTGRRGELYVAKRIRDFVAD
jgi:hypothetical protein